MTNPIPLPFEDPILADNTASMFARAQADRTYSTGNWGNVADLLSQWGDHAPTLPLGSVVALSHAGIGPTHPIGQQVIAKAVPALPQVTTVGPHDKPQVWQPQPKMPYGMAPAAGVEAPPGMQVPQGMAPVKGVQGPPKKSGGGILGEIGNVAGDIGGAIGGAASSVQNDVIQPINRLIGQGTQTATGGAVPAQQVEAGFNAQDPNALVRGPLSALNTGLIAEHVATNLSQIAPPTPGPLSSFGIGAGTIREGSLAQKLDPHQFPLYNQLVGGQSAGTGLSPSGQAAQTAAEAATQAASINYNGRQQAYTIGRGLASSVVTPGTRPYTVISGLTDALVALKGDPAAALLNEFSTERALGHTFTATPEEAFSHTADHLLENADTSLKVTDLRGWSGITQDTEPNLRNAIIEKLKSDPGSALQLTEGDNAITTQKALLTAIGKNSLGASTWLRPHVNQPFPLQFLNSAEGNDFAQRIADMTSWTDVNHEFNKRLPTNMVSALTDARTADDVKYLMASELGTTLAKNPVPGVLSDATQQLGQSLRNTPGFGWLRPLEDMRLLHALPDAADKTDSSQMVEQAERHLVAANVPRSEWDQYLRPVADARTDTEIEKAYTAVGDGIASHLSDVYGLNPNRAKTLTRFFGSQSVQDRQWAIDSIGHTPYLPGIMVDGKPVPLVGPVQPNELLNRVIPALNVRKITQASTRWRAALNLYDNQGRIGGALEGYSHLLDFITSTWKGATLAHLSVMLRMLADGQGAMAADGHISFLNHPIKMLGLVTNKTLAHDFTGQDWLDTVHDFKSKFAQAMGYGQAGFKPQGAAESGKILLRDMVQYPKGHPMYNSSWGDEISQLATNPLTRELAKAVRDPNYDAEGSGLAGIDAIKQSMWDGALREERMKVADARLEWGSANLADSRAWSDAYVEHEQERLLTKTSGTSTGNADPDLINAVADGTPFGTPGKVDPAFVRSLDDKQAMFGPDVVKGHVVVPKRRLDGWNAAVRWAFSKLMDQPSKALMKSPTFRQAYAERAPDLMPFMTAEGQRTFIEQAADAGVHLNPVSQVGELSAEDADAILKAHALEVTRKLLYTPGQRVTATDKLRNITPFADAWRGVFSRWSKIVTENPQVVRRVQQGVTSLQQNGFFHPDPAQGGKEVFTMVPAGVMKAVAGAPFPMTGAVSGSNIALQGLPGIGPAITLNAAPILSAFTTNPTINAIRDKIYPYGLPDTGGGVLETLFPGWLDKARAAGAIAHVPMLGELPSQREQITVGNLAKDLFSYKVSAGTVDMHNLDSVQRGWTDAGSEANKMYMLMSLGEFSAPAVPSIQRNIQLKNGSIVETYLLAQDYSKMLKADNNDSYKATWQFIQKYGVQRIFSIQRKSESLTYGLGTGPEAQAFTAAHGAFAQKFPNVYGYWAPTMASTQRGSYQDWLDSVIAGQTKPLSMADWTTLAESRVGNAAYNQARQMVGVSPNTAQRQWLSGVHQKLVDQYPGFGQPTTIGKPTQAQLLTEVENAAANKDAPPGQMTDAVRLYLQVRNQALTEASARGYKTLSSPKLADLKSWLLDAGTKIATKYPVFTNMWNSVFQHEVDPNA